MNSKIPIILVIEDEKLLLKSIEIKMKNSHLESVGVNNAESALEYLEKASPLPDMIWLDYYLKNNMNGLDFLKKIHGNSKWSKIPVIVVSN
ncbi:MAG: response regulator, partial [Candidatus Peregrinibacteria bacterium]